MRLEVIVHLDNIYQASQIHMVWNIIIVVTRRQVIYVTQYLILANQNQVKKILLK